MGECPVDVTTPGRLAWSTAAGLVIGLALMAGSLRVLVMVVRLVGLEVE